jgi:hypothetical protein
MSAFLAMPIGFGIGWVEEESPHPVCSQASMGSIEI